MDAPRRPIEALQQSDLMYRRIVNAAAEYAILMLDADGRIATWNAGARRLLGYSAAEIIRKPCSVFFTKEDAAAGKPEEALKAALSQGIFRDESWQVRKDGAKFWASVVLTPVYDPPGTVIGYCRLIQDMTATRKAQDELLHSERIATIGRMAAGAAHELNNVLGAVMGLANVILIDAAKGRSPVADAREIIAVCGRAAVLVRSLLALGRRKPAEKRDMDLNALIESLQTVLRPVLGARIALKTRLAENLARIAADGDQLSQIIMNLCLNARDAMGGSGEIEIATEDRREASTSPVSHGFLSPGRYSLLCVRDTGPGLSPGVREHLFEPFFSTKKSGEGSGLGLSVIYQIAQSHGAVIDVPDLPGGARFHFYFPAQP